MSDYERTPDESTMPLFAIAQAAVQTKAPLIARVSDPNTSHQGAAHITSKREAGARMMLKAISELQKPEIGVTANEAAKRCKEMGGDDKEESYRKRIGDLKTDGKIRYVCDRPCSTSNRRASAYEVLK